MAKKKQKFVASEAKYTEAKAVLESGTMDLRTKQAKEYKEYVDWYEGEGLHVPKGVGDKVEAALEKTGVAAMVKKVFGEDCGCDERKDRLNELFIRQLPVRNCMSEDQYQWTKEFIDKSRTRVMPQEQVKILEVYNWVFGKDLKPTSCGSCIRDVMIRLKKVVNEYNRELKA